MIRLTLTLSLLASPALATEGALPMDQAISLATAENRAWCEEQGGTLQLSDNPATAVDLTSDGTADDWIVNETGAFCGPDYGFLGGSGGAMIHAVIGNKVSSWLGGAWMIHDLSFTYEGEVGPPIRMLMLGMHGSACDSFGAAPCVVTFTWDGERLIAYAPSSPEGE